MSDPVLPRATAQLSQELPVYVAAELARRLRTCDLHDWSYTRRQLMQVAGSPHFQALIGRWLDVWHGESPQTTPVTVAFALETASIAVQQQRQLQGVSLVWTGPATPSLPLRRTEQALLQVIHSAERSLLIVSFAVYKIPAIAQALVSAADRGVTLTICVESSDPADPSAYDTPQAFGSDVLARAAVYVWPRDRRPFGPNGKPGSLHAKCAVADSERLFISSANLTEYAMNLNMELGALIEGGPLPSAVVNHFNQLIQDGVLQRIEDRA